MWEVRLALTMGKSLTELRRSLLPGELELYQGISRIDGPWWGTRHDELASGICHTIASVASGQAGKDPPPFSAFRIVWGEPKKPTLLSWNEAKSILKAGIKG